MPFCLQVAVSIANHMQDLPDFTHSVKVATVPDPTKDNLTAAWKAWVQSAGMQMVNAAACSQGHCNALHDGMQIKLLS